MKSRSKIALFQMGIIQFEFDFQKRKQLRFSEVNYLNYTKKTILHVTTTVSIKRVESRRCKTNQWTHSTPIKTNNYIEYSNNEL